mgnify:CR=1 FL=1
MTSTPLKSLADVIVKENARLMKSAHNEEELRIGFEKILDPVLKSIGVIGKTRYERMGENQNGKNMPNVWLIGTEPSKELHFARFPSALCEIPIKSSCPQKICKNCGKIV